MSPASAGPGAHETESRSRWTLRQLGSVVHQQVAGSKATAEPNICKFGILFARLVNHGTRFSAENGQNCETHRPQALPYSQFGARTSSLSSLCRGLKVKF